MQLNQSSLVQFCQNYFDPLTNVLDKLDPHSLLRLLASHRALYSQVQRYLFTQNTSSALLYQESWLKKGVLHPEITLKISTIDKAIIKHWVARKDITTEARFFGLLFINFLDNISLVDESSRNNLSDLTLISSLESLSDSSLANISSQFIYYLPLIGDKKDEIFTMLLKRELAFGNLTLFNCLVQSNLSQQKIDQLYRKFGDITEENIGLIHKTLIMILPYLSSEKTLTISGQLLQILLLIGTDPASMSPKTTLVAIRATFKLLVRLLPHLDPAYAQNLLKSILKKILQGESPQGDSIIEKYGIKILLPRLRTEDIKSLFPLLLNQLANKHNISTTSSTLDSILPQLQQDQIHAVHVALEKFLFFRVSDKNHNAVRVLLDALDIAKLVRAYATKLEPGQTQPIIASLSEVFMKAIEKNDTLGWMGFEILITRLNSSQISTLIDLLLTKISLLASEDDLRYLDISNKTVLTVFNALKPYLKPSTKSIIIEAMAKVLNNSPRFIRRKAAEILIGFASSVKFDETLQLLYHSFLKWMDKSDYIIQDGEWDAILSCLGEIQIKAIFAQITDRLYHQDHFECGRACVALIAFLPRLKPDEIRLAIQLLINLFQDSSASTVEDEDYFIAVVKTLANCLRKVEPEDGGMELFSVIQVLLQDIKYMKSEDYGFIYTTLTELLPKLSPEQIISVLPGVLLLSEGYLIRADAIIIANFLQAVSSIDFDIHMKLSAPEKKPILNIIRLMQHFSKPLERAATIQSIAPSTEVHKLGFFKQEERIANNSDRSLKRLHDEANSEESEVKHSRKVG